MFNSSKHLIYNTEKPCVVDVFFLENKKKKKKTVLMTLC